MNSKASSICVAVVIPSFRVSKQILSVIERIPKLVDIVYVVDDACPEKSGDLVEQKCSDSRVRVIKHAENQGVGGAVMTGYIAAIQDGADIVIKIDGDGQMDPGLIPNFIAPILDGEADYTKGNRFFDLESVRSMPKMRLFGNAVLSFLTKLSSGYWDLFDPTNGFTAIHSKVARHLPLSKISKRYFFETDILFRLNTLRAVVVDVPMTAVYGEEVSGLKISKIVGEFFLKHVRNCGKRIFYNYYLRDLSLASFELPIGLLLLGFGMIFGGYHWALSLQLERATPPGTVMVSALPVLTGLQLILAFIGHDIASTPKKTIYKRIYSTSHENK